MTDDAPMGPEDLSALHQRFPSLSSRLRMMDGATEAIVWEALWNDLKRQGSRRRLALVNAYDAAVSAIVDVTPTQVEEMDRIGQERNAALGQDDEPVGDATRGEIYAAGLSALHQPHWRNQVGFQVDCWINALDVAGQSHDEAAKNSSPTMDLSSTRHQLLKQCDLVATLANACGHSIDCLQKLAIPVVTPGSSIASNHPQLHRALTSGLAAVADDLLDISQFAKQLGPVVRSEVSGPYLSTDDPVASFLGGLAEIWLLDGRVLHEDDFADFAGHIREGARIGARAPEYAKKVAREVWKEIGDRQVEDHVGRVLHDRISGFFVRQAGERLLLRRPFRLKETPQKVTVFK